MSQLGEATGARVCIETFIPRRTRGAGSADIERIPYLAESAVQYLQGVKNMVLVGAKSPIAFFAYPNVPSKLYEPDCQLFQLASAADDLERCLRALVAAAGAEDAAPKIHAAAIPEPPSGPVNDHGACAECRKAFAGKMPLL